MPAIPDETAEVLTPACEHARDLAAGGDLHAAAAEFQRVLAEAEGSARAEAAFGLAAVREARGDGEGAREACRLAVGTGDPEYAPRAAYHLALSCETAGLQAEARTAWEAVLEAGPTRYQPGALFNLANLAADDGDPEAAARLWQQAAETGDPEFAPPATHNLGAHLLERGEVSAAQEAFTAAAANDPSGHALVNLGVTHLEQAIAAFQEAMTGNDREVGPLATELLARTLPLRGADGDARRVWEWGLQHPDPEAGAAVRARLRRDLDEFSEPGVAWWDEFVEAAAHTNTMTRLAADLFTVVESMYRLAEHPEQLRAIPGAYPWGARLTEHTTPSDGSPRTPQE